MKDFTEQQLMSMPLQVVRGLDIDTPGQESLVQKVVNRRLNNMPVSTPIFRRDIPDIQNQEQEAEWQAKIDARTAKLKPMMEDGTGPLGDPAPVDPIQEPVQEPVQHEAIMRERDMAQASGEGKSIILKTPIMGTIKQRGRPKKN